MKAGTLTGHPNICGMLDFFEDGEFYYLVRWVFFFFCAWSLREGERERERKLTNLLPKKVMPQAGADPDDPTAPKGQDLFDYVDLHPDGLSPPSIRSIFSQIADALYFLHEHGIVHRDIKDENIVLDHRGHVMVIDFGSAAYVAKDGTRFDTFSGTLEFVEFSLSLFVFRGFLLTFSFSLHLPPFLPLAFPSFLLLHPTLSSAFTLRLHPRRTPTPNLQLCCTRSPSRTTVRRERNRHLGAGSFSLRPNLWYVSSSSHDLRYFLT